MHPATLLFPAVFALMMPLFPVLSREESNERSLFMPAILGPGQQGRTGNHDGGGTPVIKDSSLSGNPSGRFETPGYPGIFIPATGHPILINSTIQ